MILMTIWNIKRMNMYRYKKRKMLMTMMLMTIQLGQSRKRVVILRILIFSTGTKSTIRFVYERFKCKRKKLKVTAMKSCGFWSGGGLFIHLVSVEVLSGNMVKTSTCRSFIQTLVKTSTCRSFIQNWVKTST